MFKARRSKREHAVAERKQAPQLHLSPAAVRSDELAILEREPQLAVGAFDVQLAGFAIQRDSEHQRRQLGPHERASKWQARHRRGRHAVAIVGRRSGCRRTQHRLGAGKLGGRAFELARQACHLVRAAARRQHAERRQPGHQLRVVQRELRRLG